MESDKNPDETLQVTFYKKNIIDNFLTAQEGKEVRKEKIFKKIEIPGRLDLTIDDLAYAEDFARFPAQYQAFINETTDIDIGTRLENWDGVTAERAEELKHMKFFTVEQLANSNDYIIQRVGMDGLILRKKAKDFLAKKEKEALIKQISSEKDAQIEELREMINKQSAMLEKLLAKDKKVKDAA